MNKMYKNNNNENFAFEAQGGGKKANQNDIRPTLEPEDGIFTWKRRLSDNQ